MPGMKSEKIIFVYADWMSTEPQLMGRLHVSESRGKEIFSFEYDESWLNKDRGMFFDPDLYLYAGRQYAPMDKPPWTTLRTLEAASLSFEEGGADSDEEKWLKINGFLEFLREQMVKTWERKISSPSHALRNTFYQRSAWWIADGRPVRWSCLPALLSVTAG